MDVETQIASYLQDMDKEAFAAYKDTNATAARGSAIVATEMLGDLSYFMRQAGINVDEMREHMAKATRIVARAWENAAKKKS